MAWQNEMNKAVCTMLSEDVGLDAVEVLDFEDRTYYGGYCETCSYESVHCMVTYIDSNQDTQTYEFYGAFSELIRGLTKR